MKNSNRILAILFFASFFLNCYLTPLLGDDYVLFQLSHSDTSPSMLENLYVNLKNMYFTWGGRTLVHLLDGVVLSFKSRALFATINTGVLFLICNWFTKIISTKNPALKYMTWILAIFLVQFGFKSRFQVLYMITGSANYLWSFAIVAAYIYNFSFIFISNRAAPIVSGVKLVLLCLLAFFTGATNENVGACLLAIFCLYQAELYWKHKTILPAWVWMTQVLLAVSTAILLFAPGNYIRLHVIYPDGLPTIDIRIRWWIESILIFLGRPDPLIFLTMVLGTLRYLDRSLFKKLGQVAKEHKYMFLLPFIMVFIFLASDGNFYGRKGVHSFLIFGLAMIIVFIRLIESITIDPKKLQKVSLIFLLLIGAKMGFDTYHVTSVHKIYGRREAQILLENQKHDRANSPSSTPILTCSIDSIFSLEDMNEKSNEGVNYFYAKYIGVRPLVSNLQPCKDFLEAYDKQARD